MKKFISLAVILTTQLVLLAPVLSAETEAAHIEFHEHLHSDGMMRMRPVDGGIVLPAGESVIFKPGGLHIMLFNIEQAIVGGDSTQFVLDTDHCGSVEFSAEVHSLKSTPMAKKHH